MAKATTYIKSIRAQVKCDNNGKVPEHLDLTIRNYANALQMRDELQARIIKEGVSIVVRGSMGNNIPKQHPLLASLYQWETLVQKYAKDLGGTAAKAAMKIDPVEKVEKDDAMKRLYEEAKY